MKCSNFDICDHKSKTDIELMNLIKEWEKSLERSDDATYNESFPCLVCLLHELRNRITVAKMKLDVFETYKERLKKYES